MLFNIYIADIADTFSRKFMYANDMALATKVRNFTEIERLFNNDLDLKETLSG